MKYPSLAALRFSLFVLIACLTASLAAAQATARGTIEGRVLNTRNGEYLEKARLTIEGTGIETFTDSSGQYRFSGVPVGAVKVRVFFTGLDMQTETVVVADGATVQRDFTLDATLKSSVKDKDTGVVKLSEFKVGASKEMDGAAIAINEQRFASNMVNVVSADEFGHVAEGNVGEFLKFIPGISMDYGGGDARTISLGGAPSNNVPVTIGGFSLSSAASSGTSRTVELEQVSINNIARIEVYHSPTPESPGSALAGGVNMVPRGAFERSKPVLNWSTYLMFRDAEKELKKTPWTSSQPSCSCWAAEKAWAAPPKMAALVPLHAAQHLRLAPPVRQHRPSPALTTWTTIFLFKFVRPKKIGIARLRPCAFGRSPVLAPNRQSFAPSATPCAWPWLTKHVAQRHSPTSVMPPS